MPTASTAELAARARETGRLGHRHRVHGRGPLPAPALPRPDRPRRRRGRLRGHRPRPADRGARPRTAGRRPRRPGRSRSSCTPHARTSRCCAATGAARCATSSTRRSPRASRGCAPSSATSRCSRRCSASGCASPRRSPAGTTGPLTEEQLSYAREDVLHLLQLAGALQDRLDGARPARVGPRGVPVLRGHRRHARPRRALRQAAARQLAGARAARRGARARRLARGRTAQAADRPVSTVLHDAALVEIAKRRPQSLDRLRQIRGLNEATLHRRGTALLEAVERGREREPIPVERRAPAAARPAGRAADRAVRGARAHARGP